MTKPLLGAFLLALLPLAAGANCAADHAVSCPAGQSWDMETQSCKLLGS